MRFALRSELTLQVDDFQRSPGDELCWSFHPHSFDVAKTKGMSLEKIVKRHLKEAKTHCDVKHLNFVAKYHASFSK